MEDEQDLRNRTRHFKRPEINGHTRPLSESEVAFQDLVQLAKQHGELYPMMVDILKHYSQILQREVGMYVAVSSKSQNSEEVRTAS